MVPTNYGTAEVIHREYRQKSGQYNAQRAGYEQQNIDKPANQTKCRREKNEKRKTYVAHCPNLQPKGWELDQDLLAAYLSRTRGQQDTHTSVHWRFTHVLLKRLTIRRKPQKKKSPARRGENHHTLRPHFRVFPPSIYRR